MATFILKLASNPRGGLCGTVRRAANGETRAFADPSQLMACLAEWNALESARAAGWKEPADASTSPEAGRIAAPGRKERKRS
jgi:hypothetical protein